VSNSLSVIKLGGSVLTDLAAYEASAAFLARQTQSDGERRLLAVVSAEDGHTDELAREAAALASTPDPAVLDLLWSTGELRSVALLTLALKHAGVSSAALNAHEAGLRKDDGAVALNPINLRAALARHSVVVVPGFLATSRQQIVTLGRGGSDLSAVLLAASLEAGECVLVKDVDGYFTEDPAVHARSTAIPALTYEEAIAIADRGCPLVQRQALVAAIQESVTLIVRSFCGVGTVVSKGDTASELCERAARAEWGNGAPRASA
jgi:aspartate kinase